ncbi:MAG: aldo/keto reductase [Candidatus Marinimicrobia bacterium]|nr:aldo/keto reductase [Candidatus Neomarinimicrobiota bacterium]
MEYRKLGTSDLDVSVVGLGTWPTGGEFFGKVEDQRSIEAIQASIDNGINLIDTAPAYGGGHAEEVVGQAIKGRRDEAIIATKVGTMKKRGKFLRSLKPDVIREQIDNSLKRLDIDVIDLYQIHWPDPDTPLEESLEELIKQKEAGKFKYLGVSNFKPSLMDKAREITDVVSLQPQYSLLKRDIEKKIIPYCQENDMGILSYGTLAGGVLTGKYKDIPEFDDDDSRSMFYNFFDENQWPKIQNLLNSMREIAKKRDVPVAQVAINWTFQQPGITSALVGAKNADQATSNAAAGDWKLSKEELDTIETRYQEVM